MRALLSVSNKEGLVPFARLLHELGYTLVASGGTARTLRDAGLPVIPVADLTGFPQILDGRVKTLHPHIHGGILARRTPEHLRELSHYGIEPIDVVVVNLYPFEETVRQDGVTLEEAVEYIDIGGVALLRAAAKNFAHVTVICDPSDYAWVGEKLREGTLSLDDRRTLAVKAFRHTALYDAAISTYLSEPLEPSLEDRVPLFLARAFPLRYGENPHQEAGLYLPLGASLPFQQLHGKAMSYNNWLDLDAAWRAAQDFSDPTVAIIKHNTPCGLASAPSLAEAFQQALASDPVSAFGSVIAVNRPLDLPTAEAMRDLFIEVIAAPAFEEEALALLKRKSKHLRLLLAQSPDVTRLQWRSTVAGWLAQTPDRLPEDPSAWRVVTERPPSDEEWNGLVFAWQAVKHVKSNAILLAQGRATVGIGAGQMSRVDAVRMAVWKAGQRAQGAVLASDAFFPFPDGVEVAASAGVTAIVQPGGSKRDADVIAAADRLGMAMVFTGVRHFRH
ncbi:MAG: bifunctional phosphoribosylaminoimidazolecarboxamide formyltransferase/IMP cyclohydrolase [Chloroflexi bacterium]|nr:bifunctional phosphoribosylaminoimidazolecarboxamide formyltransferase/IMP cyclohydrolase [Chloroflexota bacterium]